MLIPAIEPSDAAGLLDRVDALLLTGGADVDPSNYGATLDPQTGEIDPYRDARDIALAQEAVNRGMPTLAICRGCQVLNVALGGALVQHVDGHFDVPNYNQLVHEVEIEPGSMLGKLLGLATLGVNTLHHQAVATPAPNVQIVARATDGTIEAVEARDARAIGVQWHPEMLRHVPEHLALFEWLVARAARD